MSHSLSDGAKPVDIIFRCPPNGLGAIVATDYLAKIIRMAFAQISGLSPEVGSLVVSVIGALVLGAVQTSRRVPAESVMGWAYAAVSLATVLILARASDARRETGTDVFCNNKILEEMAETWKNELRLG